MGKIIGLSIVAAIGGYVAGFIVGMILINRFSSNTHDRSMEAAMTSAFVIGPLGAILALALTLVSQLMRQQR
ncbi:MAG: hypothetical protein ACKV2V_06235 [Blastocatellia bacterium]